MKIMEVVPGTKLELEVFDDYGERIEIPFVSEMEWCDEEDQAVIAAPIVEGVVYPIRIGARLTAYFYGKTDAFKFSAEVIERGIIDNIALLKVNLTSEIIKIQRREFFRFEFSIPVKYREFNTLDPDANRKVPFTSTITKDLSGGGISVYAMEKVERNKILEIELQVQEDKSVKFIGKIVRVTPLEEENKYRYDLGVSFKKIEYRDKEAVIKRIFTEQRKLRKKGLI